MDSMNAQRIIREAHNGAVLTARYNHSGDKLLTGGEDAVINLWDPKEEEFHETFTGHGYEVNDIAITSNNSHFYSGDGGGSVYYWDLATGVLVRNLEYHNGEVNVVRCWQQGEGVVSGGSDCFVRVWDPRSSESEQILELESNVLSLCLTSTNNIIAGCIDGTVREIDSRTRSELKSHELKSPVTCMCLGENDNYLLASCMDSTLRLLNLRARRASEILQEYKGHRCESSKIDCGFYNLRNYVVGGSEDGKVFFWKSPNPQLAPLGSFTAHTSAVTSMAVHPDHRDGSMVTASANGTISFWGPSSRI